MRSGRSVTAAEPQHTQSIPDPAPIGPGAYQRRPGEVVFTHTEIDPAFEGHGLGSTLARAALDDARSRGESVVPRCQFIRAFIDRHPDYADLVAQLAERQAEEKKAAEVKAKKKAKAIEDAIEAAQKKAAQIQAEIAALEAKLDDPP